MPPKQTNFPVISVEMRQLLMTMFPEPRQSPTNPPGKNQFSDELVLVEILPSIWRFLMLALRMRRNGPGAKALPSEGTPSTILAVKVWPLPSKTPLKGWSSVPNMVVISKSFIILALMSRFLFASPERFIQSAAE